MRTNRTPWLLLFAALAVPLAGCEGIAAIFSGDPNNPDDPGAGPGKPPPLTEEAPFTCVESASAPEPSFAHRLSRRQLERTLNDVFARFLGEAKAGPLVSAALAATALPADADRYKRWTNELSSAHAQGFFELADALAKGAASSANYAAFTTAAWNLRKGSCAALNTTAPSAECQKQLIRNLGLRFLRRPLVEGGAGDEVEAYRQEYAAGDAPTALGNVVFRMLLAPGSLFRLEVNEQPVPGQPELLALSSHAVANRLSYAFWNAPPDEALLALAESADLSTDEGFAAALAQVMGREDRFEDSTQEFFGDWLHLDKVPQFQSNDPATFALYAGNVRYDSALRDEMVREVRELGSYVTRSGGTLKDLFTTEVSFARGAELMKLYGVTTPAPAQVTPANAVLTPPGTRPGLLTRAALLVTGAGNKNPVLRGNHLRQDILCLPTPPPPGNLPPDALAAPAFNVDLTARERYAQKTSVQPCAGCHSLLNPPGFALSNYNGLGRYETTEPAFNQDGSYAGKQLQVNASADLSASLGAGAVVSGPVELAALVAERPEARQCLTQEYARYFLARELTDKDGCRLNRLNTVLREGKPLREFMQSLAREKEFRLRRL